MNIVFPVCRNILNVLATGPLAAHVDAYKQYLTERGCTAHTFASCLGGIAHFAQWIGKRQLCVKRIDEAVVARFLDKHLPHCRCSRAKPRHRRCVSAALGHLLAVLRAQGVIALPAVGATPVDDELRRYDAHMDHVRGLALKTRKISSRI